LPESLPSGLTRLDPRVAIGTPEEIAAAPQSYTGQYLKQVLKRRGAAAKRPAEAAE
jgi:excinuclease ABC subunit A